MGDGARGVAVAVGGAVAPGLAVGVGEGKPVGAGSTVGVEVGWTIAVAVGELDTAVCAWLVLAAAPPGRAVNPRSSVIANAITQLRHIACPRLPSNCRPTTGVLAVGPRS